MPNNIYQRIPLQSSFAEAFADKLAEELDQLISGYVFMWNFNGNCFSIRKQLPSKEHLTLIAALYFYDGLFDIYCYGDNYRKRRYDLTDPANSIEVIVGDLIKEIKLR